MNRDQNRAFATRSASRVPILCTKLYVPPLRPDRVPRPRLVERLTAGLQRKLTLVSAPAGYGKTTLVSEWVAGNGSGTRVAWLSLGEGDNDPALFLTYLIAALQRIQDGIGDDVLGLMQAPRPPSSETLLTMLVNEIDAIDSKFALILDDYHAITNQAIHDVLDFLIDHLPPAAHLMLVGRLDPPLALSRLRAGGQMTEIRPNDLRFTRAEVAAFLNDLMGLDLSPEDIAALERRTEGWIAGLQLTALSLQGRRDKHEFVAAFSGSHHYIIDYLVDEVMSRQPKEIQTFLRWTSILERFCAPLCDRLLESEASQQVLLQLEAANLFLVPLDDERRWYRYHHLFADLLRHQLQASQPDLVPTLHLRASEWYAQNDLMSEAITHAVAAEDFERAAQLTEQTFLDRMSHGEDFATMLARLEALPDEIIRARPRLGIMYAWMLSITLQLDAVEPRLQEVERMTGGQLSADLRRQIACVRAELARHRNDLARAIELSRQVLQTLPENPISADMQSLTGCVFNLAWAYLQAGDMAEAQKWFSEAQAISQASITLTMVALKGLALIQEWQGQLHQAASTCRQGQQVANEAAQQSGQAVPAAAYIQLVLGNLLREWNQLDEAESLLAQGLELGYKWRLDGETLRDGYLSQVRLKQAQGDVPGAYDAIRQAEELAQAYQTMPGFSDPIAACRAQLALAQAASTSDAGYLEAVEEWPSAHRLEPDGPIESPNDELEYLIWVRLLLAQDKPHQALQILARLLQAAEHGGRTGRVIEILVLRALTQQSLGDTDQALMTLKRALSMAEPEGYVRTFVDEGAPMASLLAQAVAHDICAGYAGSLLAAIPAEVHESARPGEEARRSSENPFASHVMVERLSERELEILRLLKTELTGPEIARELMVSLNTLRTHTKNIYAKLNVNNRRAAVRRAEDLRLS